jgi:penicillin-binding protein 2
MNSQAETSRVRLSVIGIVVLSLFAAMFSRLWYLQVMDTAKFQSIATRNRVRIVHEEAPRGLILDRKGRPLVTNRSSLAITVSRAELKGKEDDVTPRLAALLGISKEELSRRINDPRFSPYKPVPVATDVDKDKVVYVKEHAPDFPGVDALALAERSYPKGALAAHLLGYVGEINDTELKDRKNHNKAYRLGDSIGKSGVELTYEDDLRGTPGETKYQVDASGNVLGPPLGSIPPEQGHNLQLTIDLDVQQLAEDSLAQGLDAARRTFDKDNKKNFVAPAGSVVVMDPRDGSVLAMASNPTFDPTSFINGIKPDVFAAMQDPNSHFPLTNRVIAGQYAPGSTFKLVTSVAGLRDGLLDPNSWFLDTGSLRVGNRIFYNAGKRSYGRVNLARAITVSSDAYFYSLGANFWNQRGRLGETAIQDVAHEFGLGERTGIPLPAEAKGRISDPATRKKLHDEHPTAFPEGHWFAGDNVNLAIGQGETVVTPLQLVTAYSTFANGGTVFEPRVAARVLDQAGTPVRDLPANSVRKVALPGAVRDPVLQGLEGAVAAIDGTAHGAFAGFNAFPIAGKTGTAQVTGKQDTAVFVGFGPANNPQYVVAVFMEEAGFGGAVAAPVARRIFDGLAGKPVTPIQLDEGKVD